MAIGDIYEVQTGSTADTYYVDTGMYDTPEYGAVYVIDAERPALIDTGIGTRYENILDALESVGVAPDDLDYIVPTHVHLDHAGGAGFLAAECENAEVVCHEVGARHLVDPERIWEGTKRAVGDQFRYYVEPKPIPADRIREVTDGDTVDLGDRTLDVHHAPGHAPHQAVFHSPSDATLFAADACGIYVPALDEITVTSPPPNFDLEQCLADVQMVERLDPETLCYGHFGPAETDDRLAEYTETLTDWVEQIDAAREELGDDEAVVERLVAETEMDEVWGEEKAAAEASMNTRGVLRYLDQRDQ